VTGTFMIRHGNWKYVHHVGFRPQLFDLAADPGETRDLAADPAFATALAECEGRLRAICDPEAVSARAFSEQARKLAEHGGIDRVLSRGDFGYTPAPGQAPAFA
jgi:choline-sulfatase